MSDKEVDELAAMADVVTPMAIRVAATLRLADLLDRPRTAAEIAEPAGADPGALERLMRYLVTVGVLDRDDAGRFTPTALGAVLADGHPGGLRAGLDIDGPIGRGDRALMSLLHSVRTGEAAFPVLYGESYWRDLAADPVRAQKFDDLRSEAARLEAPAIVAAYDWGALGDVMDVGGGSGALLIALLNEFRELRGTVFELPGPAEAARKMLDAAGLADRADAVAGDCFEHVPPGAEGYLVSAVIHTCGDDDARRLLANCATAAGEDGAVFLIDQVVAPDRAHADLRNLAWFGGKVRDVPELTDLAVSAGLAVAAVHTAADLAVLELRTV